MRGSQARLSAKIAAELAGSMELVEQAVLVGLVAAADFHKVQEIVLVALAHRVKETLEALAQQVVAKMVLEEAEVQVL